MTLHFATNQTGRVHEIAHAGRKYLVAPVVALRAGVINGYLVTREELAAHVAAWNGRPLTRNHPQNNGEYVSANTPDIWSVDVPGQLWNVRVDGDALKGDIWIDLDKATKLGEPVMAAVNRLRAGQPLEVSTGYFADQEPTAGIWNGVAYQAITRHIRPDHLALLPDGMGACSWQDGCGAPRVNGADRSEPSSASAPTNEQEEGGGMDEAQERSLFGRFVDWLRAEPELITNAAIVSSESEGDMSKTELVAALVANERCKFAEATLNTWAEADLQTLQQSLGGDVAEATQEESQPVTNAAQVTLPPEITAFAEMIRGLGGVDKLQTALGGLTANADAERAQLVADLTTNSAFTADDLAAMPTPHLHKLAAALQARDYSAGAGSYGGFGPDEEELAMPSLNGTGGN